MAMRKKQPGKGEQHIKQRQKARKLRGEARALQPKPGTLAAKIARIRADKTIGQAEKDRMIKSIRQQHGKRAAEG